ncbi:MAG: hypothetical protein ACRC2R_19505 [Xenococcaceae cyanobacterium]
MKQVLTVSCKLQVTAEQVAKIEATLKAFADACEYVNQVVPPNLMNELAMQSLVYQDVRASFGLSSQQNAGAATVGRFISCDNS